MNEERNKAIRKYFRSDDDLLKAFRKLGKRALYLGAVVKTIIRERMAAAINAGKKDEEVAEKLGISSKTVQRFRKILWKPKGK